MTFLLLLSDTRQSCVLIHHFVTPCNLICTIFDEIIIIFKFTARGNIRFFLKSIIHPQHSLRCAHCKSLLGHCWPLKIKVRRKGKTILSHPDVLTLKLLFTRKHLNCTLSRKRRRKLIPQLSCVRKN